MSTFNLASTLIVFYAENDTGINENILGNLNMFSRSPNTYSCQYMPGEIQQLYPEKVIYSLLQAL